jgi:hypothetical protein
MRNSALRKTAAHCSSPLPCVARWLVEHFGVTAWPRAGALMCVNLCFSKDMAAWLTTAFGLTADDARHDDNWALRYACYNGRLDAAKWLAETFSLGADDARARNSMALRFACGWGHLSIAQWLVATYHDARDSDPEGTALVNACREGHLDVAQWLVATFSHARGDLDAALDTAFECDRKDIARWLVELTEGSGTAPAAWTQQPATAATRPTPLRPAAAP